MVPNDLCRLCKIDMRETGVFSHSIHIFERRSKPQAIAERLKNIGLTVTPDVGQSERICPRCVSTLTRLERDLPVFRSWESEYGGATSETITIKREREPTPPETITIKREREPTPPLTPTAPKKRRPNCPNPEGPGEEAAYTRKSITEVITTYPSRTVSTVCNAEDAPVVTLIQRKKWRAAAKKIMKHTELSPEIKNCILDLIDDECVRVCSPKEDFMLYKTSPEDLESFSFEKLESDLQRLAPFLLSVFHCVTNNSHLTTCAAAAIALRGRQNRLSAFAHYLNSILRYGGAKKSVFTQLSKMSLTTSHQSAIVKEHEVAATYDADERHLERDTELTDWTEFLDAETVEVKEVKEESERDCLCPLGTHHCDIVQVKIM